MSVDFNETFGTTFGPNAEQHPAVTHEGDASTVPVTIGLDVLEALLSIARPHRSDPRTTHIMLDIAKNAAREARNNTENTAEMPPLLDVIEALPRPSRDTWEGSLRSSFTNCLAKLLNKALPEEREAIYSDLGDLIDKSECTSWHYEMAGMAEVRRLLTADNVANAKVNHFIGCLAMLEQHGFQLIRDVEEGAQS